VTAATLVPSGPTPTATGRAGTETAHGGAFDVLAVLLVGALLISVWRLRRRTSGPET